MPNTATHFLDLFFERLRKDPDRPLLYERRRGVFNRITRRDVAGQFSNIARALYAVGITPESRVAFQATPSALLWMTEWSALVSRAGVVVVPRNFALADFVETLAESKSRLAIVSTSAAAQALAAQAAKLPDLKHIVIMEGASIVPSDGAPAIHSWNDFMDLGSGEPDRSAALARAIAAKDTAIMFYSKDEAGRLQASRYSHALLLEHARKIATLLGAHNIKKDEVVVAATAWEHVIGHIASCYLPVLENAVVQITPETLDISMFENGPQIVVGTGVALEALKEQILQVVQKMGPQESKELRAALALGKSRYESASKRLWPWQKLHDFVLKGTIVKKVMQLLGGRLRLLVSVDEAVHYDTMLFFYSFGIELIELPLDVFK